MKLLHVHVAVNNLPQSIGFYSALFAAEPAVGHFSLYIRSYWGKQPILDGSWQPPKIVKAN